jgi:hypothetical protein
MLVRMLSWDGSQCAICHAFLGHVDVLCEVTPAVNVCDTLGVLHGVRLCTCALPHVYEHGTLTTAGFVGVCCSGGLTLNDFILADKINDLDLADLTPKKKAKFWA